MGRVHEVSLLTLSPNDASELALSPSPVLIQWRREMRPPLPSLGRILTCGPQAGPPWSVRLPSPSASAGRSRPSAGSPPLSTCGDEGTGGFHCRLWVTPSALSRLLASPGSLRMLQWRLCTFCKVVILSQCTLALPISSLPTPPHLPSAFIQSPPLPSFLSPSSLSILYFSPSLLLFFPLFYL